VRYGDRKCVECTCDLAKGAPRHGSRPSREASPYPIWGRIFIDIREFVTANCFLLRKPNKRLSVVPKSCVFMGIKSSTWSQH